ncbi:MAG: hypothetical protein U9Q40_02405 [Campylobacterota bacterium]|nr:hypothetical protein [Campylobacterota bacterium]
MRYILILLFSLPLLALSVKDIPKSLTNLDVVDGELVYMKGDEKIKLVDETPKYSLKMVRGDPVGTKEGLRFHFVKEDGTTSFDGGTLFYALADLSEKYPRAKWKRYAKIDKDGYANIAITNQLEGKYDFSDWKSKKHGVIYYRLQDKTGHIAYEGKVYFRGNGAFSIDEGSIIEGPYLALQTNTSITIQFETLYAKNAKVTVEGVGVFTSKKAKLHEVKITGLKPNTRYKYSVNAGGTHTESYTFKTAPKKGTRKAFSFAFTSDSRNGIASGERTIEGVNAYMIRRIAALSAYKDVAFVHFTGDMIDGYCHNVDDQMLQYVNWKRAVLPYASHIPFNASMGNHEAMEYKFTDKHRVPRFPYATESSEALFAKNFANPLNGPESEDGAYYDPSATTTDFPTYKENVYYYTYDNVAIVSLNSDYWYAPSIKRGKKDIGGNPHAYVMDQQLAWFKKTLNTLQINKNIDHIFVTLHTPVWPNGGHVKDDMWYHGKNDIRPLIADKYGNLIAVKKGIIERRDELWTAMMESSKVYAVLTGDEHNYARLAVKPSMPIYNDNYKPEKPMKIARTIYQIHNGAAGAPYYAKEDTPWNVDMPKDNSSGGEYLQNFTTQNALVFFHINGKEIKLEVINPDTLDTIDQAF